MDDTPLHEILFQISYQLCREFNALSPYEIDERTFDEVVDLYADMRTLQIGTRERSDPNRVVRRPAGDDWF